MWKYVILFIVIYLCNINISNVCRYIIITLNGDNLQINIFFYFIQDCWNKVLLFIQNFN